MSTVKRRIIRAGGWGIAKRLIKPIPIVGSVFAFGLAGYEIRRKGLIPGAVHVGLDVTPFVGTANLMPWTVPGGVPYAMPKFSVIIPTRTSTGDFDEMCLLAGAESSPIIDGVEPAGKIVADMAAEAAAILARKH